MPELPEVETVRRSLEACVVGQRVVAVAGRSVMMRVPLDLPRVRSRVVGRRVAAVRRRAKYLLMDLDDGGAVLVHLGMSGRLRWQRVGAARLAHDHAVFVTDGGFDLCLFDPRRFGRLEALVAGEEARHPVLAALGLEPLAPSGFDGAWLFAASRGVAAPIKNFLMDGRRLVGVGNIYASEALFAAGVHPARRAGGLSRARCQRLARSVREVLERAILAGGTTLRDFADARGSAGMFRPSLAVYGREALACPRCLRAVTRVVQSGRATFLCARCQR